MGVGRRELTPPGITLGVPWRDAVLQVSVPGGQKQPQPHAGSRNRWENLCLFTRELLAFSGRAGVVSAPPVPWCRAWAPGHRVAAGPWERQRNFLP